jgi:hypothetical protein
MRFVYAIIGLFVLSACSGQSLPSHNGNNNDDDEKTLNGWCETHSEKPYCQALEANINLKLRVEYEANGGRSHIIQEEQKGDTLFIVPLNVQNFQIDSLNAGSTMGIDLKYTSSENDEFDLYYLYKDDYSIAKSQLAQNGFSTLINATFEKQTDLTLAAQKLTDGSHSAIQVVIILAPSVGGLS